MKTFEIISTDELDGTALEGYITTTRRALAAKFGEPDMTGTIDNKITTEWVLKFEDGTIADIYDWKRDWDDLGAPELDEVYTWHIGGHGKAAVYAVTEALGIGAEIV